MRPASPAARGKGRLTLWRLVVGVLNFGDVRDARLRFVLGTIALVIGAAVLLIAVFPAYWD